MSEARELPSMFDDVLEEMAEDPVSNQKTYITTDSIAEQTIRKIKAEQADCDRMVRLADEAIDYYTKKKQEIQRKSELRIGNWKFHLQQFFGTKEHKKLKTQEQYALPSGKLTLVFGKTKQRYIDADGNEDKKGKHLAEWLELHGYDDFVKVTIEPDWAELKKHITANGTGWIMNDTKERLEGIEAYVTDNEFEVK